MPLQSDANHPLNLLSGCREFTAQPPAGLLLQARFYGCAGVCRMSEGLLLPRRGAEYGRRGLW